ncbi:hypothetical protein CSB80_2124 [Staphylococcus aureus]|nr:hypothetical protein CSB80_2124 [Staphylococcus aureus]
MELERFQHLRQLDIGLYMMVIKWEIRFGKDYGVQIAYVRDESLEDLI